MPRSRVAAAINAIFHIREAIISGGLYSTYFLGTPPVSAPSSPHTPDKKGHRVQRLALFKPFDDVTMLGIVVTGLWLLISLAWTLRSGPGQLLWLCDVATLGTAVGLLMRSRLLLTAQFTGMLLYHVAWHLDFVSYAVTGWMPLQATAYMFGNDIGAYEKSLSFAQHTLLLPICAWGLIRIGVSRYGWVFQAVQAGAVLLLTWALTSPVENVNWVFGAGFAALSPAATSPVVYYLLLVIVPPLVAYAPANRMALALVGRLHSRPGWTGVPARAIPPLVAAAAVVAGLVGWACQPSLHFPVPVAEDPMVAVALSADEGPRVETISFGVPPRERRVPLYAWPGPLPLSPEIGGRSRVLLLHRLLNPADVEAVPSIPQQLIVEGTRSRKGTVVCAIVGAVTFHVQSFCDANTALERFRIHAQLGNDGVAEFVRVDGQPRVLADNQINPSGPVQSLFLIAAVAFNGQRASRSPFFLVRRTGIWDPDDVAWRSQSGVWTATHIER